MRSKELYTGFTSDLRKRLKQHNDGGNVSTKSNGPWKVVYYEACLDKTDAKRREGYLKTSQGRQMIRRRLKNYFHFQRSNQISTVG